jgi:hypothetical protein
MPAESAVAEIFSRSALRCMLTVEVPALKNCQRTEKVYRPEGKEYEAAGAMTREPGRDARVASCICAGDLHGKIIGRHKAARIRTRVAVTGTTGL